MARRRNNAWDRAMGGFSGRGGTVGPGQGDIRQDYGPDPDISYTGDVAPPPGYGQGQAPIGEYSVGQGVLGSWMAGGGVGEDWTQMSDIANDYQSYLNAQEQYEAYQAGDWAWSAGSGYDTVDDWWQAMQDQYFAGYQWWSQFGPGGSSPYAESASQDPMTGGSQGGFGDLGEGSIFESDVQYTGWYPGQEEEEGGLEDEEEAPPENYWLDPDFDSDCYEQYQAYASQSWFGGESYEEFASGFCG